MSDGALAVHLLPAGARAAAVGASPAGHRRAICSLATGSHRQLLAVASPTLVAYAQRWAWDLVLSSEDLVPDRPPSWAKVRLIQELLAEYRTVLWIDSDALVVDLERDILEDAPPTFDVFLAEHPQASPGHPVVPNAGVLLVHRSPFTVDFLDRIWNQTGLIDHNWWENAALLTLLGYSLEPPFRHEHDTPDRAHVGYLDLSWNSVPDLCSADRPAIRHHARANRRSFETRLAGMTADLMGLVDRGVL